jgi:hypothetical protein
VTYYAIVCFALQCRNRQVPVEVVAEVSEDDYPTSPIPIVGPLPPVPPPGPAPSGHFSDGSWGRAVDQESVDMEFVSFVAFIRSQTGGWVS